MNPYLEPAGFLGTGASLLADLTLLAYLLLIIPGMVGGWWLAKRGKHRPHHKWFMITITVVNWVLIIALMIVAYLFDVPANLPVQPGNSRYLIPSIHGVLGLVAQLLATYVVYRMLKEDIQVARAKARGERNMSAYWFTSAKWTMWTVLILWLMTSGLGVFNYLVRYNVLATFAAVGGAEGPVATAEVLAPRSTPEVEGTAEATVEATVEAPLETPEVEATPQPTPEAPVVTPEVIEIVVTVLVPMATEEVEAEVEAPAATPEVIIVTQEVTRVVTRVVIPGGPLDVVVTEPAATAEASIAEPAETPEVEEPATTPEVEEPAITPEVFTATETDTPTATRTPTRVPTATNTPWPTITRRPPTATRRPFATATRIPITTPTATRTPTPTPTRTPGLTVTPTNVG